MQDLITIETCYGNWTLTAGQVQELRHRAVELTAAVKSNNTGAIRTWLPRLNAILDEIKEANRTDTQNQFNEIDQLVAEVEGDTR